MFTVGTPGHSVDPVAGDFMKAFRKRGDGLREGRLPLGHAGEVLGHHDLAVS